MYIMSIYRFALLCPNPLIGLKLAAAWYCNWYAKGCILKPYNLKQKQQGLP